jgi:hypothetical protein
VIARIIYRPLKVAWSYLIAEQDQSTTTPTVLNMLIMGVQQIEPTAFDIVESFNGGHCKMISQPSMTANAIR